MIVMIVSVPERPSTPSEQFVTFIDTHTSTTVSIAKTTGGMTNDVSKIASVTFACIVV